MRTTDNQKQSLAANADGVVATLNTGWFESKLIRIARSRLKRESDSEASSRVMASDVLLKHDGTVSSDESLKTEL